MSDTIIVIELNMQDPLTSIPTPYLQGRERKKKTHQLKAQFLLATHHKKNWQTSLLFWLRDIKQIAGLPYSPPSRTQRREPSSGCQTILFRRIVLRGFIVGRVILLSQRGYKVCETQLASWGCKTPYSAVRKFGSTCEQDSRGQRVRPPASEEL